VAGSVSDPESDVSAAPDDLPGAFFTRCYVQMEQKSHSVPSV